MTKWTPEAGSGAKVDRLVPKGEELNQVRASLDKHQREFAVAAKDFYALHGATDPIDLDRRAELQVQMTGLEQMILRGMQILRGKGWDKSFKSEYLYE